MEFDKQKLYLVGAGVLAVGLLFLARKGKTGTTTSSTDPNFHNDTLYVPTNSYDVKINNGELTQNTIGVINSPVPANIPIVTIPKPVPVTVTPLPTTHVIATLTIPKAITSIKLASITSIFPARDLEPDGSLTPQTVDVIKDNGDGWYIIKTWKGNRWVKPNYFREPKSIAKAPIAIPTPAKSPTIPGVTIVSYTVRKGDTLSSIAKAYGTSVAKIATDNGIKNVNIITIGQVLKIKK